MGTIYYIGISTLCIVSEIKWKLKSIAAKHEWLLPTVFVISLFFQIVLDM